MDTSLKECVQAKSNETRWMVGGTTRRERAGLTENGTQTAMDVGVQDAAERRSQSLGRGADAALAEAGAW